MSQIGTKPTCRRSRRMSASLIGPSGSSTFRLSINAVSMSLAGSCFSSESAPGPFHGAVAELVGIEGGVVSGVINLESSGVEASDWRPRHDERPDSWRPAAEMAGDLFD